MRRTFRRAALPVACAAALVAGTPAMASAKPSTVTPIGPVTFTNIANALFQNTTTGSFVTCSSSVLSGTTQAPPAPPFKVSTATFETPANPFAACSDPSMILVDITSNGLPWSFNAASHASGVTTGTLGGVRFTFQDSSGCDATIGGPGTTAGTVGASYTNVTGRLKYTTASTNLVVKTADADCDPGIINVGDSVRLSGEYQASPKISITLP